MLSVQAGFGWVVLLGVAWLLSEKRRAIPWRVVVGGAALQWALAALLLGFAPARAGVLLLSRAADGLQAAADAGTLFLFGYLGGAPPPFLVTEPNNGLILAMKILPLVLIISALSAVLFHWGVLQRITGAFAWLLRRTLGIDGALALAAAVHIFLGMIEAPLLVRPYLARMQRGELFAMMSCGMAGVAGTVMVLYASVLRPVIPDALGAILAASVISTPAALAVAALMVPFGAAAPGPAPTLERRAANTIEALIRGTADGVGPLVAIFSTLLVTVALVTLCNQALTLAPLATPVTLQGLAAWPFRPVMWLIGIPWSETGAAGLLMGTKTVLNEFVAYLSLAGLPDAALSPHSRIIMTYALCGFANIGSLGILVGGLCAMVPERRADIAGLGVRSLLSGTIATCMSGAIAGLWT